jgi:small GTP-binding protein
MVGKTSMSIRFIKGKFQKIELSNRTINASCYKKNIEIEKTIVDLNIWDTAGEEKYHALAPIFYRGAQGAVIIFDVTNRETFNRATKWFNELSNYAEGKPKIVLVGNKIDLPNREISNEEASKLATKYNCFFIEASAYTGKNVDEIFHSLATLIYQEEKKAKIGSQNIYSDINGNLAKKKKLTLNIVNNNEVNSVVSKRKGGCC